MFLAIGFIFAIICAALAHQKGRSVVGWFFIGFFFGIFGLILILVVSNLKETKETQEHIEMEQRRLREQLRQERIKTEQLRKYTQVRLDVHDKELGIDTRQKGHLLEQSSMLPRLGNIEGPAEKVVSTEPEIKKTKGIKTQCPHCQAKFRVSYEYQDKEAKCPKCNKFFIVSQFVENTAVKTCACCGRKIEKLEQGYESEGGILCQQCHERLQRGTTDIETETDGWYYQEQDTAVGPLSLKTLKLLVQEGKVNSSTYVWHESLREWTLAGEVHGLGMETRYG